MKRENIQSDIARRTGGEIFIGVVGPMRTGKSTFVAKMMSEILLDLEDEAKVEQLSIDLPLAGSGRGVTTIEPKFCPREPATVDCGGVEARVRFCDSAGFICEGADFAGGAERKISTPWQKEPMTFEEATLLGTKKVCESSNLCVLITTDGSFLDINRGAYKKPEREAVEFLKSQNIPFVVVINSSSPKGKFAKELKESLKKEYGTSVLCVNVPEMGEMEVCEILKELSNKFNVKKVEIGVPQWMTALRPDDDMIVDILQKLAVAKLDEIEGVDGLCELFSGKVTLENVKKDLASGVVTGDFCAREGLFFEVLSKDTGVEISDELSLITTIKKLQEVKEEYDMLKCALLEAEATGYGVVVPQLSQLELFEPELLKEGGSYGVKLRAKAPSLHIMKVDVETELSPIVGTEAQGEELVRGLLSEFEHNRDAIWETNMLGRPLSALVRDGLSQKLSQMPPSVRGKIRKTVGRIVNEGKGGVICILL